MQYCISTASRHAYLYEISHQHNAAYVLCFFPGSLKFYAFTFESYIVCPSALLRANTRLLGVQFAEQTKEPCRLFLT